MQMQQAFMMQVMQQRRGHIDPDDLDLHFPGAGQQNPKRSLRAMMSGPQHAPAHPATWKRYKQDALADASIAGALADAPARADAQTIDAAHVDALAALVGAATKAPADTAVSQVGAPAALVTHDGAPPQVDAPQVGAPQVDATRGASLLDAMIERDRERSEIKKQEKAAENEIKKQEKAAE